MRDDRARARAAEAAVHRRDEAIARGDRMGRVVRRGVDRLVPHPILRRVVPGTALTVDSDAHSALFYVPDLVPQAHLAGVTWGYPWRAPTVGEELPVFLPDAPLAPWVEPPPAGSVRWLYYEDASGLNRVLWVPMAESIGEELVATDFPFPGLIGYATEQRAVLRVDAAWLTDVLSPEAPTQFVDIHTHPDWGFAATTIETEPRHAIPFAVAPAVDGPALIAVEALPEMFSFGLETPYLVTLNWRWLTSTDGGATWTEHGEIEAFRPIENPLAPGFTQLVHSVYQPANLGPIGAAGVGLLPLTDTPYGAAGVLHWIIGDMLPRNFPLSPPLFEGHDPMFWVMAEGNLSELAWTPPTSDAVFERLLIPCLRQKTDGSLVIYAATQPSKTVPPEWHRGETTWDDLPSVTWTPLDTTIGRIITVSEDGQALIAVPNENPSGITSPSNDDVRYYSDDFGATWALLPEPWGATATVGPTLRLVDIPANDARAEAQA